MSKIGTSELPLRIAVVGSGPSGFYAIEALYKTGMTLEVDLFDRLPTPFGLVRGGVAPDHPKIKTVTKVYDKIAASPGFEFLGNVTVGRDITVDELRAHYHAVLFTCGAETDQRLGIPGEELPGSYTATEFVGWYNGHPDYRDRQFDLSQEVAVIVGQGNVAIDVSRILCKTVDELRNTDIAQHALDALAESKIKEVHLIGRRGPVQAKFTAPELREFGTLAECSPVVRPDELLLESACQAELDDPNNQHAQKNYAILQEFASRPASDTRRRFHCRFLLSPVELMGAGRVENVRFERNRLVGESFKRRAEGTGEFETLSCGLFFRSVGYRGRALPGVPFDEKRGMFPNEAGRIGTSGERTRLYAAGWIKRGPSGVIGTNKPDAVETVQSIVEDLPLLEMEAILSREGVREIIASRGVRVVSYEDWQRIDAAEQARGQAAGKPREKFTTIEEMLAAARSGV